MASIREYEGKHLKEAERVAERRIAVANQVARVRNQLDYEMKADPEAEAAKLEAEVASLATILEGLKREDKEYEAAAAKIKAELECLAGRVAALEEQLVASESVSKELKKKARVAADQVAALKRSLSGVESRLEQLSAALEDVLAATAMEGTKLPVLTGRRAAKAQAAAAAQAEDSSSSDEEEEEESEEDDDDEMDVDGEEGGEKQKKNKRQKTTKKKSKISKKRALSSIYDYSILTEDDRRRDAKTAERHGNDMKVAMEQTAALLARMAPNLKAVEQYEDVKVREREQVEELEGARRECKSAAESFNSIRQRRFDLFSAALTHVTSNIDPIYKDLTRSSIHPSGGQAYLAPENPEDPFSGGIKFSAMPPTKRFRDMEQLSGGEKTVAALALLFAVHSFHPSPFFVLDEIDAALDASNVAKVAAYMRSKTRPDAVGSFQGIVISLKDVFYEKADALVGVCRSPEYGSSETLTFDLNRYGPPMGAV